MLFKEVRSPVVSNQHFITVILRSCSLFCVDGGFEELSDGHLLLLLHLQRRKTGGERACTVRQFPRSTVRALPERLEGILVANRGSGRLSQLVYVSSVPEGLFFLCSFAPPYRAGLPVGVPGPAGEGFV